MIVTTIYGLVRDRSQRLKSTRLHTNGSYHSRDCDWALPRDGVVELILCVCVLGVRETECRVMCTRYRVVYGVSLSGGRSSCKH
jgi:hypothetical protein